MLANVTSMLLFYIYEQKFKCQASKYNIKTI